MATYLFKCVECGRTVERSTPEVREGYCYETGKNVTLVRDWKAEGVGLHRESIRAVPRG